jgi:hypothetical protein
MTWSWIYAFTGMTGALWVILSGILAGMGGGDSGADASLDGVDGMDGMDGALDGLDASLDAGMDGGLDGADSGFHAHLDGSGHGLDSVDAGHASGEAQPGFPFLSPYVISTFLAAFGITGYALLQSGFGTLLHLPVALVTGLGLGGAIGLFFHKLRTSWSGSSETRRRHLLGAGAQVSISIPAGKVGEVTLVAAGTQRGLAARSLTGAAIPVGTSVRIERLEGSTAVVRVPAGESLERLHRGPNSNDSGSPEGS